MDQNSQIVGVSASLDLGIPRNSRAGRLLHPLLVGKRKLLGEGVQVPGRIASVAAIPLALWLGLNSSNYLPQVLANVSKQASQLVSNPDPVSVGGRATTQAHSSVDTSTKPTSTAVQENSPTREPGTTVAVVQPQLSPLPGMPMPGGVGGAPTPYPVPANAEFVNPSLLSTRQVQSVEAVASKTTHNASKDKEKPSSMLVIDVSGGDQKSEVHQPPTPVEGVPAAQKVEQAKLQVANATVEQAAPKDHRSDGPAPNVKLPALKDAPTEARTAKEQRTVEVESMASAKPETPKAKVVQAKEPAPVKKPPTKAVAAREEAPANEPKKVSSKRDGKLFDEGDDGFAAPIRMKSIGAKQEPQRQSPTRSGNGSGSVEVIDVTSNSVIVTNPNTNLPMQVRVGGRLPNGQVVTNVDKQSGSVQTSGGVLRLN